MAAEPTDTDAGDAGEPLDPEPGRLQPAREPGSGGSSGLERAADGVIDLGVRVAAPFVRVGFRSAREVGRRLGVNPAVERQVNRALESDAAGRTTQRVLETPAANQVWEKVLESDQAQKLVERVAEAPEVRSAITSQGIGLLEDVRRTARGAARRLDGLADNLLRRLRRRPRRRARPIHAGGATRLLAILFDAAVLSGMLLLLGTLVAALLSMLFSVDAQGDSTTVAVGAFLWWVAAGFYLGLFWMLAERTPGMTFFALRISTEAGGRVMPHQDLRRLIGFALALIPFGLGFLGILTREDRRGWHDRFADTIVVYADPELDSGIPGYSGPEPVARWRRPEAD